MVYFFFFCEPFLTTTRVPDNLICVHLNESTQVDMQWPKLISISYTQESLDALNELLKERIPINRFRPK